MPDSMRQQGDMMRERAVSLAMKRKEEYLGARVPRELRERVTAKAKELGIPVSILIRNILEGAFKEPIISSASSPELSARDLTTDKEKFASVLGWKTIKLQRDAVCTGCEASLCSGEDVSFGLGGIEPVVLCDKCKSQV